MKMGIIGTGDIASAMVSGLRDRGGYNQPIHLSRRGEAHSSRLVAAYNKVIVCDHNQDIVDACDMVVVAVLPEQARKLYGELRFQSHHVIVSLVAGLPVDEIAGITHHGGAVLRCIPMPPIELGIGPIPIFPDHEGVRTLLGRVGSVIPLEREEHLSSLAAASAVMASFYELQATQARWLQHQGVGPEESAQYVTSLFQALSQLSAAKDASGLQRLSAASCTPKGLNAQILQECREHQWFEIMATRLDHIADRLRHAASQ